MRSFFNKEKSHEIHATTKIVVAAATEGAGVSLVSELIASNLSELSSVSVTELGKPHFYDALNFEKRFLFTGFVDFFEKIRNSEHIRPGQANKYENINWIVRKTGDNKALQNQELFRAMYFPKEEYCIFDCSGLDNESSINLLAEADIPVLVIDPLPSRLVESRAFLEKVRVNMPEAVLIVNKMNNGVHKAELNRYLGTNEYFSIDSALLEYIYKAEYNSVLITSFSETKKMLAETQDMLHNLFQ